jgi:hypothetical protein
VGPGLERERVSEQAQPTLRPSAGGRGPEEGERQILCPDRRRRGADLEELLRVRDACRGQASDLSNDLFGPAERIDRPEDVEAGGVVGRNRDLVGDRGNLPPRLVVESLPVGAYGDRVERFDGPFALAAVRQLTGDPREVADHGRARPRALGYLQIERGHRAPQEEARSAELP